MKNVYLFVIMMLSLVTYSQEKVIDSIKKKEKKISIYYGGNISFNDNLNLNKKLRNKNLPEFNTTIPDFLFGLNYFGKDYSGDLEFGFMYSKSDKGNYESKLSGYNWRLRVHYNLVNREKFAITSGLSLAYVGTEYDIFTKNNTIDLDNLEPNNNSGHVNFTNGMLYFGPSTSFYFLRTSDWNVRLNLGYEFALTRGRYNSEFGAILNNIEESGNNRFVIGIIFN